MSETIRDLAVFVRSKNAGPFMLTIDLFFDKPGTADRVARSDALSPERIAAIYGVDRSQVRFIQVPQANAIKLSFPRPKAAGDVGDTDVAGGQQFLPVLDLEVTA